MSGKSDEQRTAEEATVRDLCPCGKVATVGTHVGAFCEEHATGIPSTCDFCTMAAPMWRHPCRTFVVITTKTSTRTKHYRSIGDWAACETCSEFIRRRQWDSLLDRMSTDIPSITSDPDRQASLREFQCNLLRAFRENRTAEPYRVDLKGNRLG